MRYVIGIIFLVSGCSSKIIKNQSDVNYFNWLVGNWKMKEPNSVSTENWVYDKSENVLRAMSMMGKSEATLKPFENIVLKHNGSSFEYVVTTANQNNAQPIIFSITNYTPKSFVAENKQHDYPKRIAYELIHKDSIKAYIDDGTENQEKRIYFNFTKQK
jgi:hypothetical protein